MSRFVENSHTGFLFGTYHKKIPFSFSEKMVSVWLRVIVRAPGGKQEERKIGSRKK